MAIRGLPNNSIENQEKEIFESKENHVRLREIIHDIHKLAAIFSIEDEPRTGYFWHDKNGQPTTDPEKVIQKIPIDWPTTRKAETDADFQFVFEREMKKRNIPKQAHIEVMTRTLEKLKEGNPDNWHFEYIKLIEDYLLFLNKCEDESILTYDRLFKDPQECKRITGIIENQCENGIFKGFKEAATVKPGTQLRIIYDLLTVDKLKNMVTMKGSINEARRVFFARFGLNAIRGREIEETDINIQAAYKPSKPNIEAKQELSLIFLNR